MIYGCAMNAWGSIVIPALLLMFCILVLLLLARLILGK